MPPLLSTPLLLRTQSDSRLVALAADGHDRAFEAIVERYRRPAAALPAPLAAARRGPRTCCRRPSCAPGRRCGAATEVRDLRPWLYRIAHNTALNNLRAAGCGAARGDRGLPRGRASRPTSSAARSCARRWTGSQALPERQREALLAVAVADRPHADVAAELGISDGALRQLLLRARTTLRAAATALTPYPLVTWLAGEPGGVGRARGRGRRGRRRSGRGDQGRRRDARGRGAGGRWPRAARRPRARSGRRPRPSPLRPTVRALRGTRRAVTAPTASADRQARTRPSRPPRSPCARPRGRRHRAATAAPATAATTRARKGGLGRLRIERRGLGRVGLRQVRLRRIGLGQVRRPRLGRRSLGLQRIRLVGLERLLGRRRLRDERRRDQDRNRARARRPGRGQLRAGRRDHRHHRIHGDGSGSSGSGGDGSSGDGSSGHGSGGD